MNLIKTASEFAIRAHESINQVRKGSGEPYWKHPERVAATVSQITDSPEVIAAAWLHDVLEDVAPTRPEFGIEAMSDLVGQRVTALVLHLTDVFTSEAFPNMNRVRRKWLERERIALAGPLVHLVKVADLIDNTANILVYDKGFASLYLSEKAALLALVEVSLADAFGQLGRDLVRRAKRQVAYGKTILH